MKRWGIFQQIPHNPHSWDWDEWERYDKHVSFATEREALQAVAMLEEMEIGYHQRRIVSLVFKAKQIEEEDKQ